MSRKIRIFAPHMGQLQKTVLQLLQKAAQGFRIQAVIGAGPPLGGSDEALVCEQIHVMGNGGRSQTDFFRDVLPVAFAALQGFENRQAAFVAHGLQAADQVGGLVGVFFD